MRGLKHMAMVLGMALILALTGSAFAQQGGGGGRAGGRAGGRGGWGGMSPEQMRDMMLNRVKDQLKVTDDEWTAIKPKVQKVQELQFQAMAGRFGGRRGRGGQQADNNNQPQSPVAQKAEALRTVLDNTNATNDQIKSALDALRDARKQSEDQLKAAQDDLKSVLTVRQEAVLVEQGMLP